MKTTYDISLYYQTRREGWEEMKERRSCVPVSIPFYLLPTPVIQRQQQEDTTKIGILCLAIKEPSTYPSFLLLRVWMVPWHDDPFSTKNLSSVRRDQDGIKDNAVRKRGLLFLPSHLLTIPFSFYPPPRLIPEEAFRWRSLYDNMSKCSKFKDFRTRTPGTYGHEMRTPGTYGHEMRTPCL